MIKNSKRFEETDKKKISRKAKYLEMKNQRLLKQNKVIEDTPSTLASTMISSRELGTPHLVKCSTSKNLTSE